MKKELVSQQPNLAITTKTTTKQTYQLASLTKIFFARLVDFLIVGGFQFLVSFFIGIKPGSWTNVAIVMSITLAILVTYFIIIPLFLKGNTLGKLMFNIRLRSANDTGIIKWYQVVFRELWFWFIPWMVSLITTSVAVLIMQANQGKDGIHMDAYLIYNLGYLFFLLWFVVLGFSIKVQKQHQSGVDIKFNLYVIDKNPLTKTHQKKADHDLENYDHVALTSMPANFNSDQMNEVWQSEELAFQNSINLTDLEADSDPKKLTRKQKQLATKTKRKAQKDEL